MSKIYAFKQYNIELFNEPIALSVKSNAEIYQTPVDLVSPQ